MLGPVARLKLRLLEQGLAISAAAKERLGAGPLTLADYASTSGISMRLGQDIWVNAPIADHNPNFATNPTHLLDVIGDRFVVRAGNLEVEAMPLPVPAYHDQRNAEGELYTSYAYSHTDRVRISPVEGCALACKFCDLPFEFKYRTKSIAGLIESVGVALRDPVLPVNHVLVSGGTPILKDYGYLNQVYEAVITAYPGVSVDVMMMPVPGLLDINHLYSIGVNQLSINLEAYNEDIARQYMAGKAHLGRSCYLDFIERAATVFGERGVRSLLLVGLESADDTIAGVEALAQRGCEPVLSPFRPDPATPLKDLRPPTAEFLEEVYERALEVAARYGVKLGPRCIPCMHNTLTFPDGSDYYFTHERPACVTSSPSTTKPLAALWHCLTAPPISKAVHPLPWPARAELLPWPSLSPRPVPGSVLLWPPHGSVPWQSMPRNRSSPLICLPRSR